MLLNGASISYVNFGRGAVTWASAGLGTDKLMLIYVNSDGSLVALVATADKGPLWSVSPLGPQAAALQFLHCVPQLRHTLERGRPVPPSPIVYLAPKEDRIYDLVGRPDLWSFETPAVQNRLELMLASSQINKGII